MAKANAKKYYDLVDRIWKDGVGGKDAANIKADDLAKGESGDGPRVGEGHRVPVLWGLEYHRVMVPGGWKATG